MSTPSTSLQKELRKLPSVNEVVDAIGSESPRSTLVPIVQGVIEIFRQKVVAGSIAPSLTEVKAEVLRALELEGRSRLISVINATGVLLHTNLGRAPLSLAALDAVQYVAGGFSNLEFDLATGKRGSRYSHARNIIIALSGAESALVVNNNAAAVLLVVSSLAAGRDVVISRGELIEIGGEFRIPEIIASSGARLVEVGTTNRTHLRDYEAAMTDSTALILKVHPSNYRVVGFTTSVGPEELARLAHSKHIPFAYDLGSGLLRAPRGSETSSWLGEEPAVEDAIRAGADLVTFSGDKLLGGPQAGVIAGKTEYVAKLESSPLLRALRVDKLTLAALQATLATYLERRESSLPFWSMALADPAEIESRALALARSLGETAAKIEVDSGFSTTGAGSSPGSQIPTALLRVTHPEKSADDLRNALLSANPPILARIEDESLILDLRTAPEDKDESILNALNHIL